MGAENAPGRHSPVHRPDTAALSATQVNGRISISTQRSGGRPCRCPVLSDCLSSRTNAGTDPRRHDAADSPVCRADRCTGLPRATTQQVSDRVQVDLTPGGSRRSSSPLMTSSIRADSPACRGEHWFVGAGSQDQTDSDKIRLSSQGGLSERVTRGLRRSRGSQRSRGCSGRS